MSTYQFEQMVSAGSLLAQRFRVLSLLGAGATGMVVLAEDTAHRDTQLALKLLYPHLVLDATAFSRFRAESVVMMKLSHPNVLPTYGLEYDARGIYFQKLLFVQGCSLRECIGSEATIVLEPIERVRLLFDVARGLAYAHESGVVHRDVKPENVMLSDDGDVRVSDFGLSQLVRQESRLTANSQLLGTPYYMSPEQVRGEAVDPRSDIYSFGIMAYEVLVGSVPFEASSFFELAEKHLHLAIPSLTTGVSDALAPLDSLIQYCCEKERSKRPESMRKVVECIAEEFDFEDEFYEKDSAVKVSVSSLDDAVVDTPEMIRKRHRAVERKVWFATVCFIFILPLFSTVHWRLNTLVLWIERQTGTELTLIRQLYGLSVGWEDQSLIFDGVTFRLDARPLLLAGADPQQLDPLSGLRPIHAAIVRRVAVRYLDLVLDLGAEIESLDRLGRTPLIVATELKVLDLLIRLLERGAEVNAAGSGGATALHRAVEVRSATIVELLLRAGADPYLKDNNGQSPLEYACGADDARILDAFGEAGHHCTQMDSAE